MQRDKKKKKSKCDQGRKAKRAESKKKQVSLKKWPKLMFLAKFKANAILRNQALVGINKH